MPKTTLATLAKTLGVSRSTVSNAFSRPDQLSASLRERILAAADQLGYEGPSAAAAALRTGRTNTVGVLFTDSLGYAFADPVSGLFLSGVAEAAEAAGLALTVLSSRRGARRSALSKAMLDGLIVYSVDEDSPGLAVARRRGMPLVLVDQAPQPGGTCVNITDEAGAASALGHLAGLGHRRIGVVTVAAGPARCAPVGSDATSENYVVRARMRGWREAAESAGLAPLEMVSCPVNLREHGRHAARLLLRAPVTGIACLSDELALGVIDELAAHGIAVPDVISVTGFDDSPPATHAHPTLTTVRQPAREKGRIAARELIARIGGDPRVIGAHHILPTTLVTRESTASARPASGPLLSSDIAIEGCGDAGS
jgi:DNA-binding LacI/PurR family transcriptional regulator